MPPTPPVSIIMPNLNGEAFIGESIASVVAQTFPEWELIVTDDGSTDGSLDIIQSFAADDPRIQVFQNDQPRGSAAARNRGIAKARGRYIALLDSDDVWYPDKLARQLAFMKAENSAFSCTWYDVITEEGDVIGAVTPRHRKADLAREMKTPMIGCFTAIYDREAVGLQYVPEPEPGQYFFDDSALWFNVLRATPYCHCLQEKTGKYRLRRGSVSANKAKAALYYWRTLRLAEKQSLPTALYYFTHYAVDGLLRKTKFLGYR